MFPAHTSHAEMMLVGAFICFSFTCLYYTDTSWCQLWPVILATVAHKATAWNWQDYLRQSFAVHAPEPSCSIHLQIFCFLLMSQQEALRRGSNVTWVNRVNPSFSSHQFGRRTFAPVGGCSKSRTWFPPPFKDTNIDHDECRHHPLSSCEEKKRNEKVKMDASIMAAPLLALTVLDVTFCVFPSHFEFFFFFLFFLVL